MKKIALVLVSSCIALGSSGVLASEKAESVCNQVSNFSSNNSYPQQLNKYTVQNAYKADYKSDDGECVITVNYDFKFDKFTNKLVDIAEILEDSPKKVAELYLSSDRGESSLRQMIKEEYRSKYESWKSEDVEIFMNARITHAGDYDVENQYFNLYE